MDGSKKGAVGIGTLIIFIAMVLVAAIAAAVLINVSNILQQRAMTTGKQAIAQVSGNLIITGVTATTDAGLTNVVNMTVFLTAAAGAGRIDLSQLVVRIGNNVNQSTMTYSNITTQAGVYFNISEIRDPTNLFTPSSPVIDGSSLVQVNVIPASTIYFPTRTQYHLEFIPETGAPTHIDGVMPSSYSTQLQNIYP
ncbi:MAG: archaellin/type IV pilin N-terminal domain-containing protein [Candidatus Micrarchaeota archaeon]